MLKELLCFAVALVAVQATGEFRVLHSPDSVVFSGNEELHQSSMKELYAVVLGYTPKSTKSPKHREGLWRGMLIANPFNLPEAVVTMAIESVESVNLTKGERFPLRVDEVEETTWQALRELVDKRDCDNTLVRIFLADGIDALGQSALGELKPTAVEETHLKRDEDKKFLEEIQLLHAIAKKVRTTVKPDSKPDIYWLVISGFRPLLDRYGANSTEAREGLMLLNDALSAINDAFVQAYEGKVLITAFTNDASQVRHSRSVLLDRQTRDAEVPAGKDKSVDSTSEAKGEGNYTEFTNKKLSLKQDDREDENKKVEDEVATNTNTSTSESNSDIDTTTANNSFRDDSEESAKSDKEHETRITIKYTGEKVTNLSKKYDEDYPIIFNIILWFGVAFFFSLLAVCIAIADMDPGRDSIIYRMTSNRMKKDN